MAAVFLRTSSYAPDVAVIAPREREREMFYLTTHSTHLVKDHSDSERGNPLSPHRLLLSINSPKCYHGRVWDFTWWHAPYKVSYTRQAIKLHF